MLCFYSLSEDEAKEVFKSLRQAAGIFMQAKVFFFHVFAAFYLYRWLIILPRESHI